MAAARLAKLARPSTEGLLLRERLFRGLDAARQQPLVWIVAPPGAGKTSLVSSWVEARGLPCLWYQLDAGDGDPGTLFHYLGMAVTERLGTAVAPRGVTFESAVPADGFARHWFRDLFLQVPETFVLVFDNFPETTEHPALTEMIAEAVAQAPAGVQVVVLSRFDPPARFAMLRAARRLTVLDWPQLRLTQEETAALAGELGIPASIDVRSVNERVGGWAAGLVLMAESLKRTPGAVPLAADAHLDAIFDYFATLLFDESPTDQRDMLMRMALLPRMTVPMAQMITGRTEAGKLLSSLARRNLFVTRRPGADPVFEFHALFREFLRVRAVEAFDPEAHRRLTANAAALLQTAGQVEDALGLFSESGAWEDFTALLCGQAPEYVRQGRRQTLEDWLATVPLEHIDADADLLYWQGVTLLPRDPILARERLTRAFAGYVTRGDRDGQLRAAAQVADGYYRDCENWRPLDVWIERIEALLDAPDWDLRGEPALRAAASLLRARLYRCPQADGTLELVRRMLAHLDVIADPDVLLDTGNALIGHWWWRGEADEVERLLSRLQPLAESERPCVRTRVTHLWWSGLHAVQLVETERATALLERGRTLIDDSGLAPMAPEFERVQVVPLIQARKYAAALAKLEQRILPHYEGAPLQLRMGYFLNCAQCHLGLGDPERALELVKRAEAMCDTAANMPYQTVVWPTVGRIFIALGRTAEARAVFERMLAAIGPDASPWLRGVARVGLAHTLLVDGDAAGAREPLRAGLADLKRTRYLWGASWYCTYDPLVLAQALRQGIEEEYVRQVIGHRGIASPEPDLANWPWNVRILALGHWKVDVHGRPARPAGGKTGHRLFDLLKALVVHGPEPIDTRLLADLLWPDSEADAAVNALQVTVYRLRKWLRRDDALVVSDGTLCLDPAYCWVDAWAFDRKLERMRRLDPIDEGWEPLAREALALYRGDLLAHEGTQCWMIAPRQRRQRAFMGLTTRLGDSLERRGAVSEAILLYQRALDVDPLSEELYRRLMACHGRVGNRSEALDTYRRCREQLAATLAVAPSVETERLHLALRAVG